MNPVLVAMANSLRWGSQSMETGLWGKPYWTFLLKQNNSFCSFSLSEPGLTPLFHKYFNILISQYLAQWFNHILQTPVNTLDQKHKMSLGCKVPCKASILLLVFTAAVLAVQLIHPRLSTPLALDFTNLPFLCLVLPHSNHCLTITLLQNRDLLCEDDFSFHLLPWKFGLIVVFNLKSWVC